MPRFRMLRSAAAGASCLAMATLGCVAWTSPAQAADTGPAAAGLVAWRADRITGTGSPLAWPGAVARSSPATHGQVTRGAASKPEGIAAYEAEIANGRTGKLLWGRRPYSQFPIASITKVMTALVVIKSGDLGRRIKITWADEDYLGCCIQGAGLIPGDVLTARQLLRAMLLPSGADAARALAEAYGPGITKFVAKMNATARALKLVGTHFTSFDGVLPSNVSTPRNLLMLGVAAMKYPAFRDVVKLRSYLLPAARHHHRYSWKNTNLLLGHYRGLIGIKTGWIPASGECLLFEAVRGKKVLIGVVLDSAPTKTGQSFVDAREMLNWGFRQLSNR